MTVVNPFPGLRAFEAADSHLFFGRETATDELLKKLRTNRFITVIGTSGSGKSSLVKAGMLPDLHGGYMVSAGSNWRIAVLRPGNSPIHALATALIETGVSSTADQEVSMQVAISETVLRRGVKGLIEFAKQARMQADSNLLIVVDQFEELFRFIHSSTGVKSKEEAAAFVKLLLEASAQVELPIYVILTMRSEYLGDCTQFRDLPEAINKGQYLIPRMPRDQKRRAIIGPVAVGGAKISPRLVQRLLNDVGDNPDQLPIMQHAMMRSWEYWEKEDNLNEEIDLPHYNATGGMHEALSRHADEAFNELTDKKTKHIAEFIFKRLTGQGTDNREIRFPTTLNELSSVCNTNEATIVKVLDVFRQEGRSFLMPPSSTPLASDTLIDISHESLIRIWKRLRHWVVEEAQSSTIYRRLSETAVLFNNDQAGLWRDPDLQIALDWRKKNQPNEIWAQRYDSHFSEAMSFAKKSKTKARQRKMLIQTATILLPLGLIGSYIYDLKTDVSDLSENVFDVYKEVNVLNKTIEKKESNILDLQSSVSETKEIMKNVAQQLTKDTKKIQEQGQVNNAGFIVQEFTEAVTKLQETVEQVEQSTKEFESIEVIENDVNVQEIASSNINAVVESNPPSAGNNVKISVDNKQNELPIATEPSTSLQEIPASSKNNASESTDIEKRCQQPKNGTEVTTITSQLKKRQSCLDQADLAVTDEELIKKKAEVTEDMIQKSPSIKSDEDFVTCTKVTALTPGGCNNQFSKGKVYLFARVVSPRDEMLKLVWYKEEQEFGTRQLAVKTNTNKGYRTFAWKRFKESGNYRVALFNQKRVMIAERKFTIK